MVKNLFTTFFGVPLESEQKANKWLALVLFSFVEDTLIKMISFSKDLKLGIVPTHGKSISIRVVTARHFVHHQC